MDFRKIVGMSFLTFILISYLLYRVEWNFFMYIHIIQFFKFIDLQTSINPYNFLGVKKIWYKSIALNKTYRLAKVPSQTDQCRERYY